MSISVDLITKLNDQGIDASEAEYGNCGYHVAVQPAKDNVRAMAETMLAGGFYLDFVSAVHVESGYQVVYQFAHFDEGCHVNAKVMTEDGSIPTIADIFQGASWHERETRDFYGLIFENHPDLRVLILAEDDVDLKPLLKNEKTLKNLAGITRQAESEEKPDKKAAKADKEE